MYKILQPFWAPADGVNPKGVRLEWEWPPPDFVGATDPLLAVLYIQYCTSSDLAIHGHWPLSPDFVKDRGSTFTPAPETGWQTIATINVPPQFMNNGSDPTAIAFRHYTHEIDSPNSDVFYRIVGFIQVDVGPDRFFEWDWAPATLTIAPGGTGSWANVYGEYSAGGNCVTTDSGGNIYVAGYFRGTMSLGSTGTLTAPDGGAAMFLMKLTITGAIVWARAYGGSGIMNPTCIAIDGIGSIIVGGSFYGSVSFGGATRTSVQGEADAFIAKYSSTGTYTWDVTFGSFFPDVITALAIDSSNNIFVTGFFQATVTIGSITLNSWGTGIDPLLAKFNSSGVVQFAKNFYNAGTEFGRDILIDSGGNVYLIGYMNGYINFSGGQVDSNLLSGGGGFIAKFDNSGTWTWSQRYGGSDTRFWAAVLDASANVVVVGDFPGGATTNLGGGTIAAGSWTVDGFIAKYSSVNGAWQSNRQLIGFQASNFRAAKLARDVADNILLVGYMARYLDCGNRVVLDITPEKNRGFAAKFSPTLIAQWAYAFTGLNASNLLGCAFTALSPVVTGLYDGNETFAGKNLSGNQHAALMLLTA